MSSNEICLINVQGVDKPGITHALMEILSGFNVNLLDMGQAVIHSHLALGFLIEIPATSSSATVLKDILFRCHDLGLTVSYQIVARERYEEWVGHQGEPRHIVSLLARKLTSHHLASVTRIICEQGLNIETINRLSGRVPLESVGAPSRFCIDFYIKGRPRDLAAMKEAFLQVSTDLDVDIAFQRDNIYRRNRRLVCFDMDSTLIQAEVIDELAERAGVGERVRAITEQAMRGELDFKQSLRRRVSFLEGLDASVLEDIARSLPLTDGAERLINNLRRMGFKTAILSGGFAYFGRHLQNRLGIDYVFANDLEILDGRLTGRCVGEIVDAERKATLLEELAARERISCEQVIAVGDGANDLLMLSKAGLGIAFRAKPLVKKSAEHQLSTMGLDGILYLLGYRDREVM